MGHVTATYGLNLKHSRLTVTVTNLSPASRGHPSSRSLKPRLRYKLDHRVVGDVYYYLYTRGARPASAACLRCSCEYVGRPLGARASVPAIGVRCVVRLV